MAAKKIWRNRRQWRNGLTYGLILVAGIGFSVPILAQDDDPGAATNERYIRYGFTVQNETDQVVPRTELWICAPLSQTSMQQVLDLTVSQPHEATIDDLGNDLVHVVFSNVPPYAVKIVSIDARLSMGRLPQAGPVDLQRYLKSEPLMEHADPAFDQTAPKFPAGDPHRTARDIFIWVRKHLRDTGYDGRDRGALFALLNGSGDCTEYATLFAALSRRAGIPARAMGGYVLSRDGVLHPAAYHNWAEFYLDGRWHLADPQAGIFDEKVGQYVAMRVLGESASPLGNQARFRIIGEGMKAEMGK